MATTGDDLVPGSTANDTLAGLAGSDTIYGLQGDDLLYGGLGDDSLLSGSGDDTLFGQDGNDRLVNDGGNDVLYGGTGDDMFWMGDVVYGSAGTAYGGAGNDSFVVTSTANTILRGGSGTDTLLLSWFDPLTDGAVTVNLRTATATSTHGSHLVFSGIERLMLVAGDSDDSVTGGALDDTLDVAAGHNLVDAGAGNDTVAYAINGANTLTGGAGDDTLILRTTSSALYFILDGLTGHVDDGNLSVITGFERYEATGSDFADIAGLGGGNDLFRGMKGNDTAFGGDGNDKLFGYQQNDLLYGGNGRDTLAGGAHDDVIFGGDGHDILAGGTGSDTLTGDAGPDSFVYRTAEDRVDLITDFTTSEDLLFLPSATLGPLAPPTGRLADGLLQSETDRTTPGVFVLIYDAAQDRTNLHWTDNGHGSFVMMSFSGHANLVAHDIMVY